MSVENLVEVVYIGVRRGENVKRLHVYARIRNGKAVDDATSIAIKRKWPGSYVGRMFSMLDMGDSVRRMETLGEYHDKEQVKEWEARHRAALTSVEAESKAKREEARSLLRDSLAPVRRAYNRAGATQRRSMLAWLLWYITNERDRT